MSVKMGYFNTVQGDKTHDIMLARQDAELRLLDTMRRCIINKIKCDREFASALHGVALQSVRKEWSEELADSLIVKAWKGFSDGLTDVAREVRQGADSLEAKSLSALKNLHDLRKEARRNYHEEHMKIVQHLHMLSESVHRKKNEYQKQLEYYKTTRARFEEQYVKCGRSGPKISDIRDRYQKACKRLHLTHNEYVLLLCEANEYERDFFNILLPALIEQQKHQHESGILMWKEILHNIVRYSTFSSDRFAEIYDRMGIAVGAIKPEIEYKNFAEKLKISSQIGNNFQFDENLTEDSSGKLQANILAVDNLTLEWLKLRLAELEIAHNEAQQKLKEFEDKYSNTDIKNMLNGKRELEILKCRERHAENKLSKIKSALNDIGCEEIPLGCDVFMDSVETHSTVTVANNGPIIGRPKRFRALFKKPFAVKGKANSVSTSALNTSIGPSSPICVKKITNSVPVDALNVGDYNCVDDDDDDDPTNNSSSIIDDSHETKISCSNNNLGVLGSQDLSDQEWFHGVLPREEVVDLLRKDGDFLVRETLRNDERQIVLSVCWSGHKHFIVQTTPEGLVRFEGPAFDSVSDLIKYQLTSSLPVTNRSQAILKNPIKRECWELNNDDIILGEKIGRGNFGDVYKARVRSTTQDIAVKTCKLSLPEEHRRKFLQEGRILKQYDHPNIVKFIGICVQKQPIMIVMELVPGGSLLTYLRNNAATLHGKTFLKMSRDVASGMCYLESRNCIHRDLAARNCLVGFDTIVKISDFGMSREEEEYIVSDGMKQIPIKWTAPEALNFGKYTSLCDVWSYGVLCWEIFAKGGTPYPGMTNSKAREKIDEGYRMPAPETCPPEMYQLMMRCWEYESEKRPHFQEIFNTVNRLCEALGL